MFTPVAANTQSCVNNCSMCSLLWQQTPRVSHSCFRFVFVNDCLMCSLLLQQTPRVSHSCFRFVFVNDCLMCSLLLQQTPRVSHSCFRFVFVNNCLMCSLLLQQTPRAVQMVQGVPGTQRVWKYIRDHPPGRHQGTQRP